MALFGSCKYCGSPICTGNCYASMAQAQQNYMNQMHGVFGVLGALGGQAANVGIPIEQEIAKRRAPLPESSELCATGGIVAWREWRVPCFGDALYSFNGEKWPVREALVATCKMGETNCRGTSCSCGVYGWKKRADLKVNESGYSGIIGEVWLWGKVVEHEKGYRAQFAYPKSFVRCADAERVAKIYGVKLI